MSRDPNDILRDLDLPPDEEEVGDEELAEAQALARALEPHAAPSEWSGAPEDDVRAATLLRVGRDMTLNRERQARILEEVLAGRRRGSQAATRERSRSVSWRWWWLLPLPAAAFSAIVVLQQSRSQHDEVAASSEVRGVVRPDAQLLEAQARAIATSTGRTARGAPDGALALAEYDSALQRYRRSYLHSLDDYYRR